MEFRQIRHFIAVVDHGSFAAAAKLLGLTGPAVGLSIAALEREFRVPLFKRTGSGTVLTLFGETLLRHARAIAAEAERAETALLVFSTMNSENAGRLNIGIGDGLSGDFAPKAIASMHELYPHVRITLQEGYSEILLQRLVKDEIDIVFGTAPPEWHAHPDLIHEPLFSTEDVLIARAEHPLSGKVNISPADLKPYSWIIGSMISYTYNRVRDVFIENGMSPPTKIIWSDTFFAGFSILMNNDYLAIGARDLITPYIESGKVVALPIKDFNHPRQAFISYKRSVDLPAAMIEFIEQVRSLAEARCG
jgi:DNA-binding transcriptional LysR family regulator